MAEALLSLIPNADGRLSLAIRHRQHEIRREMSPQGRVYEKLSLPYSESYPIRLLKMPPWMVSPFPTGAR